MTTTFEAQLETRLEILTVIVIDLNTAHSYILLVTANLHKHWTEFLASQQMPFCFSFMRRVELIHININCIFYSAKVDTSIQLRLASSLFRWTHAKNVDIYIYIYIVRSYLYDRPPDLSTLRQTI